MLDWHTVKELDKGYMTMMLAKVWPSESRIIGLGEVTIRKRHSYQIVVSDLDRKRPIWFGGTDRSRENMDLFYEWLGK
jgi:transposase